MSETYTLTIGNRYYGIGILVHKRGYDEPSGELVEENFDYLVVKVKGHQCWIGRGNQGSQHTYIPAKFVVYKKLPNYPEIIKLEDGTILQRQVKAKEVLSYPVSTKPALTYLEKWEEKYGDKLPSEVIS